MRTGLFLVLVLTLAPAVQAQQGPRAFIDGIQIGFQAGTGSEDMPDPELGRGTLHKSGFWTPVYVYLRASSQGLRPGRVVIESIDSDDVPNTYTVPYPGLDQDEKIVVQAFTKVGNPNGEIKVTVEEQVSEDRFKKVIPEQVKPYNAMGLGDALVLAVGSRMPGLQRTIPGLFAEPNKVAPIERMRLRVAFADDVGRLPTRWFGYAPVDLMILATGNRAFVNGLLGEDKGRKEALAEWVRRGGHLIVSCGRNQDAIPDLFRRAQLPLPVTLSELHVPRVDGLLHKLPQATRPLLAPPPKDGVVGTIVLAKLERKPGMFVEPIVPEREHDPVSPLLLIVRWPHGLGQITLVAFDLDESPFNTWKGQKAFWKMLTPKMGLRPEDISQGGNGPNAPYNYHDGRPDVATLLTNNLEKFGEVSVISFGWVAVFILIYIIIVGPLDYLFLKKVVKRLELTWITFPTVVVVVSAVAYFAAYSLKGNDLRINKIDLIDIDLENRQTFGTSWFTVYSPRIQLYTVGVEPAAPLFSAEDATAGPRPSSVVVTWMGKPDDSMRGDFRGRSQSLFQRTYKHETDAAGLREVPIQVWSSKTFTANWTGSWPVSPRKQLWYREEPRELTGTIINPLPIALENAALIYGESLTTVKVYRLDTLEPGESRPINNQSKSQNMSQWLDNMAVAGTAGRRFNETPQTVPSEPLMKRIMFFEASTPQGSTRDAARDTALRYLDQTWRQTHKNVAILYGRVARQEGSAEEVTQNVAMPTRLWLGQLPGTGAKRPRLDGKLVQDTFVRVYIPVPPAAPGGEKK